MPRQSPANRKTFRFAPLSGLLIEISCCRRNTRKLFSFYFASYTSELFLRYVECSQWFTGDVSKRKTLLVRAQWKFSYVISQFTSSFLQVIYFYVHSSDQYQKSFGELMNMSWSNCDDWRMSSAWSSRRNIWIYRDHILRGQTAEFSYPLRPFNSTPAKMQ